MNSLLIYSYILVAFLAANLPFLNHKWFAVIPSKRLVKPIFHQLLELLVIYMAIGLVGFYLEKLSGSAVSQSWEFYVVSICLLLVFAFPGFVLRLLKK